MPIAAASARLTAEEFEARYVDVPLCELERGAVIHLSPGGMKHSRPCTRATVLLEIWAEQTGLGRVYANEIGLVTQRGPDSVRGADAAYISYARLPEEDEPEGFCPVPPELVVEVIGKGQGWKKLVEKGNEYLSLGVDRVWVLDPKTKKLHVFRSGAEVVELSGTEIVRDDEILPGFSCAVADLFERRRK